VEVSYQHLLQIAALRVAGTCANHGAGFLRTRIAQNDPLGNPPDRTLPLFIRVLKITLPGLPGATCPQEEMRLNQFPLVVQVP
jgi:hypothetical protein